MATKRHGRTGIFKGVSRTSHRQPAAGPQFALAALGGIAYSWDLISDSLTWGPNASTLLGIAENALPKTGSAFARMVEPGSGPDRLCAMAAGNGADGAFDTRYALRFGPDAVVMVQDAGRWQENEKGLPSFVRGLLRLDAGSAAPDLLPAAIKVRSALLRHLQNDIDEALRFSHACAVIVGHLESDEPDAMESAARALRPMMRRRDRFAVLGTDRFALTLGSCAASDVTNAANRVASLLKAPAHLHLGAACTPDHAVGAMELLCAAEDALDRAMAGSEALIIGRRIVSASSPASEQAPYDIVQALNERRLTLAHRPVVDAHSHRPVLVQASAALLSEDGRGAAALGTVPLLREANLALLVDGRMLELAADYLVQHRTVHLILPIATASLHDPEWLPMLAAHLGARPGIESRLLIEVSEASLTDAGATRGRLDAMKALGVGIALSGFGTGHASGLHLQVLPIDLLKIDGIFVQSLKRSTDDRLFVRTLIDIAHRVGIATVAEWADDADTARLLTSWGIDYLQGAPFGEPEALPQGTLASLLRARIA